MTHFEPFDFRLDPRRAVQAAGFLLRLHGRPMGRMRLLKLLYLADRESMRLCGRPIVGGHYANMDNGPILSEVYNLIKAETLVGADLWDKHIALAEHPKVKLIAETSTDCLSETDQNFLKQFHQMFEGRSDSAVWQYVHDPRVVPEYRQPPAGSSTPIATAEILKAVGKSSKEIAEIASMVAESAVLDGLVDETDEE